MNSSNPSFTNQTVPTNVVVYDFTFNYMYMGFGIAAFVCNFFVLFILARNFDLFKKSAFIFGLSFGDISNGLALLITGASRMNYILTGQTTPIHPFQCMQGFTLLWLIGIQVPTVLMFLIGLERIMVIAFTNFYFHKWTNKLSWCLVGVAYAYCSLSIGAVCIIVYSMPPATRVSKPCYTPLVIGSIYSSYNYGLGILCGNIALITMFISLMVFLKRKMKILGTESNDVKQRFLKRQLHLTITMACVAFVDFVMVVLPDIFLIMVAYEFYLPDALKNNLSVWSALLVCTRSALSLFIYSLVNREFRIAALRAFGIKVSTAQPFAVIHSSQPVLHSSHPNLCHVD